MEDQKAIDEKIDFVKSQYLNKPYNQLYKPKQLEEAKVEQSKYDLAKI